MANLFLLLVLACCTSFFSLHLVQAQVVVPTAGPEAAEKCAAFASGFTTSSLTLNGTFSQYWEQGSNPSLELLAASVPNGMMPSGEAMRKILEGVAPDVDLSRDGGYGWNSRSALSGHGPLGGLPAFCRFGALIVTSPVTQVYQETWMPLKYDEAVPLASVNASDYPTNSTPISLAADGSYIKAPLYIIKKQTIPVKSSDRRDVELIEDMQESSPESLDTVDDIDQSAWDAHTAQGVRRRKNTACPTCPITGGVLLGNPDKGWSGRMMFLGNGIFRGALPWPSMKQSMTRYGMAVVGTNAGHFGTTGGTTWINGTQREDTLTDWGGRATHVSKVLADEVLDAFYGVNEGKKRYSYYAGCSNGGKAALASAQAYASDFDGILAGCPGINFNRMNVAQILFQARHRKSSAGKGFFSNKVIAGVRQTILDQCDSLDGLKDGIINDPTQCKPNLKKDLLCGNGGRYSRSKETCLNSTQLANLQGLYNATYVDGHFVYPAFPYSWESRAGNLQGSSPKARFFLLAVLKEPNYDDTEYDPYVNMTWEDVVKGDNEGTSWTSNVVDLSPAINAGTKILSYHGLSDMTISAYATEAYYQSVEAATRGKIDGDLSDHFRLFLVPGMAHCRDGPGAWHFGGITQEDGGNRPLKFDTRHDMLLSLVAWVEKDHTLPFHVSAGYKSREKVLPIAREEDKPIKGDVVLPTVFEDSSYGLRLTRKLCLYPQKAVYKGLKYTGKDAYKNFDCE